MASVLVVAGVQLTRDDGEIEGVEAYEYVGGVHTETRIPYTETPAVGGPHHPVWQNCGIYRQELFDEHVVHSMEHGAVSITYRPGNIDTAALTALEERFAGNRYVLISPRAEQGATIVLSAWNRQLALEDASDPRVGIFVARYAEGPQAPESGAPCRGGTDRTVDSGGTITGPGMDRDTDTTNE